MYVLIFYLLGDCSIFILFNFHYIFEFSIIQTKMETPSDPFDISGKFNASEKYSNLSYLLTPPPPPPKNKTEFDNRWSEAFESMNGTNIVQLMIEEVAKIPYKSKKRLGFSNDHEVMTKILQQMNDILNQEFLHVEYNAKIRDVEKNDWSQLISCKRSDSGTTGIYFLQCSNEQDELDLIVAKPTILQDYEKTLFVNEIATKFFNIHCPKVRMISKYDEEFIQLENAVKKLFLPLHEELYELGGHHSPKSMFSSQGIMLLEYVKGRALCHRSQGQRPLTSEDYYTLGKLFLLDLLIRNTDRLPCRKAMPRPGSKLISDHGNAGNILFKEKPGEVWSIDPESLMKVDIILETNYGEAFESVIMEIIHREDTDFRFKGLELLFFSPNPAFVGILDTSLNDLNNWNTSESFEQEAIAAILQMIRIRAKADDEYIIKRAGGFYPPNDDDEKEWREWIRLASPRAMLDVFQFLEETTGYSTPQHASNAFERGFIDSMTSAIKFKEEFEHPSNITNIEIFSKLKDTIAIEPSIDLDFLFRMIERTRKYCTEDNLAQAMIQRKELWKINKRLSFGGYNNIMASTTNNRRDKNI